MLASPTLNIVFKLHKKVSLVCEARIDITLHYISNGLACVFLLILHDITAVDLSEVLSTVLEINELTRGTDFNTFIVFRI